jgi:tetratricopeptide (TPR) repeat protein
VNSAAHSSQASIGLESVAGTVSPTQSILTNAARRFLDLDRLDLAKALSDLALSENERNADSQSVAANILDRQGDWQNSLAGLHRAYELAPEAPQVRLNLALALLRLGDYRTGFALYEDQRARYAWLRPLELLWVDRALESGRPPASFVGDEALSAGARRTASFPTSR